MDMTNKDFIAHHRAQAKTLHQKAQNARKIAASCKDRRDFLGKLRRLSANELRRLRDYHKSEADKYAALA